MRHHILVLLALILCACVADPIHGSAGSKVDADNAQRLAGNWAYGEGGYLSEIIHEHWQVSGNRIYRTTVVDADHEREPGVHWLKGERYKYGWLALKGRRLAGFGGFYTGSVRSDGYVHEDWNAVRITSYFDDGSVMSDHVFRRMHANN